MNKTVKAFIDDALFDISTAIIMFKHDNWKNTCLNSQQAIEKLGKAILLEADVDIFDRKHRIHQIHVLNEEIESLGLHKFSDRDKENAILLTQYYMRQKYPDPGSERATYLEFTRTGSVNSMQWALEYLDMTSFLINGAIPEDTRQSLRNEVIEAFSADDRCSSCHSIPCVCSMAPTC